eukprot:TRINITY_DN11390_c0_g1_i1.p2 TRINITY_DN11390_c0_g1~~TRINITY_DN11390_c0_g1_i1.p2  ORF type:complete len:158 (+),score=31.01 TRINITY_DN11390_c0_g1_i1:293-766(+)
MAVSPRLVGTARPQESVTPHLPVLQQNDMLERRLDVAFSANGHTLFTGGFRGEILGMDIQSMAVGSAGQQAAQRWQAPPPPESSVCTIRSLAEPGAVDMDARLPRGLAPPPLDQSDLARFMPCVTTHPSDPIVAAACGSRAYLAAPPGVLRKDLAPP